MCKYLLVESRAIFEGRRNTNPSAHLRTKKDVPKGTSYLLATRLLRRRANRVAKCGKLTQFCTRITVALYFELKDPFFWAWPRSIVSLFSLRSPDENR